MHGTVQQAVPKVAKVVQCTAGIMKMSVTAAQLVHYGRVPAAIGGWFGAIVAYGVLTAIHLLEDLVSAAPYIRQT